MDLHSTTEAARTAPTARPTGNLSPFSPAGGVYSALDRVSKMSDPHPSTARVAPFTVGDWLVEPKTCLMSRGDVVEKLRPQLVDLLVCLAKRRGEIVLRDDILAEVWAGQYVAETAISRCVAELRRAFRDDALQPRFIEVIRKRDYRLVAPVTWHDSPPSAAEPDHLAPAAGLPDRADAGATGPPLTRPVAGRRWRTRAVVGIVSGLGVAAIVIAVMMTRSPASVLTEQDIVLLAFENRTGDRAFDETIPLAMSIQMEQSPHLRLLSAGRIQETLRMMQRPPDTVMTRAIGLEVCERAGGQAVIVTSLAATGQAYAIGIEAVTCGTSRRVLARQQLTVDRKERILAGLQEAAVGIRRAVGESAASVERYSVPIVQATTSSLEALRALSRGDAARERGEAAAALDLYREAVALDPDFALAHLRRGTYASARGTEAELRASFEKAYALRERVTLPERLEIEAWYHYFVTGQMTRVVDALELLKRTYPRRAVYRRSLADVNLWIGRHDAALTEALEAERLEPDSPMNHGALSKAYLYLNRIAEARDTAEKAIARGSSSPLLYLILFQCGLASGDVDLVARARAWGAAHPDVATPYLVEAEAEEALTHGRLADALALLRQYERWAAANGRPTTATVLRLRMARYEALCGYRARALSRVQEEIDRGLPGEIAIDAVKVAISAGAFDMAERLLDGIEQSGLPVGGQPDATFIPAYRAAIDASRGRSEEALTRLTALDPLDLGNAYGFIPLFERAHAYYRVGNWPMARAAYAKILAHPTLDSGRKLLPFAQLGLARTLARAGDTAASRGVYEQFLERWKTADAGLPVLAQARREYRALAK